MNYNLLYQGIFCLAFFNFFIYWIDLFFFSFSSNIANSFQRLITWFPTNTRKQNSKNFFFNLLSNKIFGFLSNKNRTSLFMKKQIRFKNLQGEHGLNQKPVFIEITKFIISLTLWCSLTLLIIFRYIQSNHFPLSNFYEALIFLTWSLVTLNFIILFEPFSLPLFRWDSSFFQKSKSIRFTPPPEEIDAFAFLEGAKGIFFSHFLSPKKNSWKKDFAEIKEKRDSYKTTHLMKYAPLTRFFFSNIFQISKKNNFSAYEQARRELQPIVSLNVKAWQPTNKKFLNHTTEFSKNLNFFMVPSEIPERYSFFPSLDAHNIYICMREAKPHFKDKPSKSLAGLVKSVVFSKKTLLGSRGVDLSLSREKQGIVPFLLFRLSHGLKEEKPLLYQKIITIPSEYYRKFVISFLYDIFVLKKIQKKKIFETTIQKNLFSTDSSQRKNQSAQQLPSSMIDSLKETKHNKFMDEHQKKEHALRKQEKKIYGGILAPCILFILAFAQFNLSSEFTPLVPALKSNWLFMHVSIMICSYTTFIVGGLLSLILLIQSIKSETRSFFFPISFRFPIFISRKSEARFFLSLATKKEKNRKKRIGEEKQRAKPEREERWAERDNVNLKNLSNTAGKQKELTANTFYSATMSVVFSQALIFPKLSEAADKRGSFYSLRSSSFFFPNILDREILQKETKLKIKKNLANQQSRFTDFQKILILQWKNQRKNLNFSSIKTKIWQQLQNKINAPIFSPDISPKKREKTSKKKGSDFNITLDNLSYRMFGIGFPLFTLGLLSGAVWANSAWGSYWSWDIKEVGSFIHWLVLTFYFHCRYKNYVTFSHLVGFFSLLILFFNFFGVSLGIYGSSLHAYS